MPIKNRNNVGPFWPSSSIAINFFYKWKHKNAYCSIQSSKLTGNHLQCVRARYLDKSHHTNTKLRTKKKKNRLVWKLKLQNKVKKATQTYIYTVMMETHKVWILGKFLSRPQISPGVWWDPSERVGLRSKCDNSRIVPRKHSVHVSSHYSRSWYPWRTGSRSSANTKLHGCPSLLYKIAQYLYIS